MLLVYIHAHYITYVTALHLHAADWSVKADFRAGGLKHAPKAAAEVEGEAVVAAAAAADEADVAPTTAGASTQPLKRPQRPRDAWELYADDLVAKVNCNKCWNNAWS